MPGSFCPALVSLSLIVLPEHMSTTNVRAS